MEHFKLEISDKSALITILGNVDENFAEAYRDMLNHTVSTGKLHPVNNNDKPDKTNVNNDDCGKYQKYNYAKQMKKRAKTIRSLVYLNFKPEYCKFVTLTFDAKVCEWDCKDLKACNAAFQKFIKHINSKYKDFLYVAVFARQNNGNWHYHMICNFDDNVHEKRISELWKYGITESYGIFSYYDFDTRLSYCLKNMNDAGWKELQHTKGYLCSHDMMRPIVLRSWVEDEKELAVDKLQRMIQVPKYDMPEYTSTEPKYDGSVKITTMVSHQNFSDMFADKKVAVMR